MAEDYSRSHSDDGVLLHIIRGELRCDRSAGDPNTQACRVHLQLIQISIDNDVIESSANATVPQILALCNRNVISKLNQKRYPRRENLRPLQNIGIFVNGTGVPEIVFPTALP